jgi:GTPase SAR1 family protein
MVYAVNNRNSFEDIDFWTKEIRRVSNPDAKLMLIGNKCDLEDERKVTYDEGKNYADDLEFDKFMETSAKNGDNAQQIFIDAATILYNHYYEYNPYSNNITYCESEKTIKSINSKSSFNTQNTELSNQPKKRKCC